MTNNRRYTELGEPCKSAIEEGRCVGCSRLELEEFEGDLDEVGKSVNNSIYRNNDRARIHRYNDKRGE